MLVMPMSVRRMALHGRRRRPGRGPRGGSGRVGTPAELLARDGAYAALAA